MQVSDKVEAWKHKLLDLGKRNRMLFFKPTKRTTLRLLEPDVAEIYDRLVHEGSSMEFPLPRDCDDDAPAEPLLPGQIRADQIDQNLMKNLHQLREKARTALQEQGVNILYVAFGFLEWTEAEYSREVIRSPLVLVPVELRLESLLDPYELAPYDDEITLNPTLVHKLQVDFGMSLPTLPEDEGWVIDDYLGQVSDLVASKGWKVAPEATLGLFSFLKINMYKDLDAYGDEVANHPIVKAIAGDTSDLADLPDDVRDPDDIDRKVWPHETFQVLDADSSQQEAILAAKRGASFVLQGPPGTGKSQTITNIIAECLAAGKRVLFVSEKMAALEVVYRRLYDSRLGDFCLQLHSHKASKKDVIQELGRTLMAARTAETDRVEEQLDQLLTHRERLNAVAQALHLIREPLGRSVFQVHGEVAQLESAPDLSFQFAQGVSSLTAADVRRFDQLLVQLEATAGRVGVDYASNPWRNCTVTAYTLELQHDVRAHFGKLKEVATKAQETLGLLCVSLGLKQPETLEAVRQTTELLALAGDSPMPPREWFDVESLGPLSRKATDYLEETSRYQDSRSQVLQEYAEELLYLDVDEYLRALIEAPPVVLASFSDEYAKDPDQLVSRRQELTDLLEQSLSKIPALRQAGVQLAASLSVQWPGTALAALELLALGTEVAKNPRPQPTWFDRSTLRHLLVVAKEAGERFRNLQAKEHAFLQRYDREYLTLDVAKILQRFRADYSGFLRFVKPGYHRDMRVLRSFIKTGEKLSHEQALKDLSSAKEVLDGRQWVQENDENLKEAFGGWFDGFETRWDDLLDALKICSSIVERYHPEQPPQGLKTLLCQSGGKVRTVAEQVEALTAAARAAHPLLEQLSERLNPEGADVKEEKLESLLARLQLCAKALAAFYAAFDAVSRHRHSTEPPKVEAVTQALRQIPQIRDTERRLEGETALLQASFGRLFQGMGTEWQTVLNALDWTASVLAYFQEERPPERFIQVVTADTEAMAEIRRAVVTASSLLDEASREAKFATELFETHTLRLETMAIPTLSDWLQMRVDSLSRLEDWIDFRASQAECHKWGLTPFVAEVLQNQVKSSLIRRSFFKRFYRLWLDEMYVQIPELRAFRGRVHEREIEEFRQLDQLQFELAQVRLRAKLSAIRPNPHMMNARGSEPSILLREVEKRRRQMPLRKLFHAIPNLLLTLKPCLLMSPLSVSQFLDPHVYQFDTVIFDEASQICSEDAIGAIFRGKQVIVVGDREQLPPTNFFAAGSGDAGFEDEDDEAESYESILDECSSVLHRKSLRWHYRSRHEHLIAFSNAEIYRNLVTFPSPIEQAEDVGVEHIYVPNGVYDRAGTRSNRVEAQRVAQMVFNHFHRFPNRSLGVVTFSEAQQSAVDAEVRNLRLRQPQFEQFFREDRDEPFFVKNLENVQGDERDTIIFSVGYAKDPAGVMHMNFGPLSRQGGQRRLNVAITRAKYNVKLVTSIRPTDIDPGRTTADGVHMLRRYMEFAKDGTIALQRQLQVNDGLQFDSPFEEAVYDALRNLGYEVDTQVGCSGYRIDLAVKDPTANGRYLLAIECDGRSYHSAKTARDRDRLREDVLRRLGWRIHRIWSTDWIKNPRTELQRTVAAIEDAKEAVTDVDAVELPSQPMDESLPLSSETPLEVELTDPESPSDMPGVVEYSEADIWSVPRTKKDDIRHLADVMAHVVIQEGPVHRELVARRVAPLLGRERVTDVIRGAVNYAAGRHADGRFALRGDFFWPAKLDQVPVRVPAKSDKPRPITQISVEERAEAMYVTLRQAVGMDVDALVVETARLLGYARTGGQIREALEEAVDYLVSAKRAEVTDGYVKLSR